MLIQLYRELNHNDRLAYLIMAGICCTVITAEFHELYYTNPIYNGYKFVQQTIEPSCGWDAIPYSRGGLNWYMVCVSYMAFGNSQVIPFLISVGLVPTTFLFVRQRSGNLTALFASAGLALTPTFLIFDSSAAYAQTWALLFVASLYMMRRDARIGVVLFTASLFCKAIPLAWLPFVVYDLYRSDIPKNHKLISYVGFGLVGFATAFFSAYMGGSMVQSGNIVDTFHVHPPDDFMYWFSSTWRWNTHLEIAIPVLFGLYAAFRKRLDFQPFFWLAASVISMAMIIEFTGEGYFPYRMIPNVIVILWCCAEVITKAVEAKMFKTNHIIQEGNVPRLP